MPGQALLDSAQIVLIEAYIPDVASAYPLSRLVCLRKFHGWHSRWVHPGWGDVDQVVVLDIGHAPAPPGAREV